MMTGGTPILGNPHMLHWIPFNFCSAELGPPPAKGLLPVAPDHGLEPGPPGPPSIGKE